MFNYFVYTDKTQDSHKVVEKVVENLTENQVKIIKMIEKNEQVSAQEIASAIKISQREVYHIEKFRTTYRN
jgi:transcriptional regulator